MSAPNVQVADTATTKTTAPDPSEIARSVEPLVAGVAQRDEDPVSMTVPPYVGSDEQEWSDFLADTGELARDRRRGLIEQIEALLDFDKRSKESGRPLGDVAAERAEASKNALHAAWDRLLKENKQLEQSVRGVATMFDALGPSRRLWKNKLHFVNASAREIASKSGVDFLDRVLAKYRCRPDPREARGFLCVSGYVGSATALRRLGRATTQHTCILVTDAPSYSSKDNLEARAASGGALESFAGEEPWHRYAIMLGNHGLVRSLESTGTGESADLYIPLSSSFMGMMLDNLSCGKPWEPKVGYWNTLGGITGVELDLLLEEQDGFDLYLRHRIIPAILRGPKSESVVFWGADTLSKADGGVQVGVACVEQILTRYTAWVINQYALLHDLEGSEAKVGRILGAFIARNSGDERMFRTGSRVRVRADEKKRCLVVEYQLRFREIAERAEIRIAKQPGHDQDPDVETRSIATN